MIKRISDIVKEMVIGIAAVTLVILLIGLIFIPQRLDFAIGLLGGMIMAVIMVCSMHRSIGRAMERDKTGATFVCVGGYIFRTVLLIGGLIGTYYIGIWSLAGFFLGVMSMKIAAYLQPYVKKILHH